MIRSDFLRSVLLAPLAALAGCKKKEPLVIGESIVLPAIPPNAQWTCTTDSAGTFAVHLECQGPDGKWFAADSATFAGNYLP